jgi:Bacterial cell division membrane protein
MEFLNKIFRGDRVIWMIFMFLCLISIVEVYSASSTLTFRTDYWKPIMRHCMFLLLGVGCVLLVYSFKPKFFSILGVLLPLICLVLIATRFFGTAINGSYRWLTIGGQTIQPSEFAKLSLMVLTAFILSRRKDTPDDSSFKWILIFSGVTCSIILVDNFSTAAMLFMIVMIMMFVGQIPFKKIFLLSVTLLVAGGIFISLLLFLPGKALEKVPRAVTWKNRLIEFSEGKKDQPLQASDGTRGTYVIDDDNYQVAHANMAIAGGKVFGKMPGNSVERDFLPQAYSDFIYAIIIEEMGIIGGVAVIFLYFILLIRAGIIARRCDKLFPKYLAIGAALVLVTQAFINMAVAVGLFPVTGQPLPLVSRGGTSTLINCVYIGMILSVSRFENPRGVKREEEIIEELEEEKEADDGSLIEIEFDDVIYENE